MGTPNKMHGIEESHPPYNPAEDFVHVEQCGCRVTFFGAALHRSSRMNCCSAHDGKQFTAARDQIHARAKRRLELAKLFGSKR